MCRATVFVAAFLCGISALVYGFQSDPSRRSASAGAASSADRGSGELLVHVARSSPAREVAALLTQVFRGDTRIHATADPISNAVFIRVQADARNEVLTTLKQLDRPPVSVTTQVLLIRSKSDGAKLGDGAKFSGPSNQVLDAIKKLEAGGQAFVSDRVELTVLENQKAMVQSGRREPVVTGVTMSPRGRMNNVTYQDVGTLLTIVQRVRENRIVMELQFEKSEVEDAEPVPDDEEQGFVPSSTLTMSVTTTVEVGDGEALAVQGTMTRSDGSIQEAVLVVIAKIVGGEKRRVAPPRTGTTRKRDAGRTATGRASDDSEARIAKFARALVVRYDKNRDGVLESDEWSRMPGMSQDPSDVDTNGDAKITSEEYARWLMTRRSPASSRDADSKTRAIAYAKGVIARYDKNGDGMLDADERSEMRNDPGDDADMDGDGKITAEEYLRGIMTRP